MLDEDQRVTDVEPEAPATFGDESQDLGFVREAAAQKNQPGLEVVLDIWKPEGLVEAKAAGPSTGRGFLSVTIDVARCRPTI